jgi:hypothetical protein
MSTLSPPFISIAIGKKPHFRKQSPGESVGNHASAVFIGYIPISTPPQKHSPLIKASPSGSVSSLSGHKSFLIIDR